MNSAAASVILLAIIASIGVNIVLYLFLSYRLSILEDQLRLLNNALQQTYYDDPEPDDGVSQSVYERTVASIEQLKLVSVR